MLLAIIVGILIAIFVLFEWWGRQPYVYKNVPAEELRTFLRTLIEDRNETGLLFIRPTGAPSDDWLIQFAKYGRSDAQGIRFAFPDAPWSASVFEAVHHSLREEGFPVFLEETGDAPVTRFAVVNLGPNDEEAVRLARIVLQVMGFGESQLRVWFEGLSPGVSANS